jgi:hypothetical protein
VPLPAGRSRPPQASVRCSGAVAQLGERLNGIQEVGGSTPLGSTNLRKPGSAGLVRV